MYKVYLTFGGSNVWPVSCSFEHRQLALAFAYAAKLLDTYICIHYVPNV